MTENESLSALVARLEAAAIVAGEDRLDLIPIPADVLRLTAALRAVVETCRYLRRWLAETLLDEEIHPSIPRRLDNVLRGWEGNPEGKP